MKLLTPNQLEVIRHLKAFEDAGTLGDFDQLLAKLSWQPSKESAQFVIRAGIQKGLLEKKGIQTRRGRNRVVYALTEQGKLVLDPRGSFRPEHVSSSGVTSGVLLPELSMSSISFIPGIHDSDTTEVLEL